MSVIVKGVDLGGTKAVMASVDVIEEKIVGEVVRIETDKLKSNEDFICWLKDNNKEGYPYGICVPGIRMDETRYLCENTLWKNVDVKSLNAVIMNDMTGAKKSLEKRMKEKGVNIWSLWTISTGMNGATTFNGIDISHELGHQVYSVPENIEVPVGFKLPKCNCLYGKIGDMGHLEVALSASGAERMARDYYLNSSEVDTLFMKGFKTLGDLSEIFMHDPGTRKEAIKKIHAGMIYDSYKEMPYQFPQKYIVKIQRDSLATAIGNYMSTFPFCEEIVFMGSQGINNFEDQVLPAVKICRENGMCHPGIKMPRVSKIDVEFPGIIGSAIDYAKQKGYKQKILLISE